MYLSDVFLIIQWLFIVFLLGTVFLPITFYFFDNLHDKGYIFSKALGILFLSYVVFLFGTVKILSFNSFTLYFVIWLGIILNLYFFKKTSFLKKAKGKLKIFILEEIIFILSFLFWSYIKAHQPEIHGIEKYMDFAFVNSILRANYFPPLDTWFTPLPINYYYFGHFITAILTKLSGLPSFFTYNLMLSTIFSLTFTGAFSIGINLFRSISNIETRNPKQYQMSKIQNSKNKNRFSHLIFKILNLFRAWDFGFRILLSGLLTAFLVTLAGNLQTIYSFFTQYKETPVPFWQLIFSPQTFPNSYWYPNATRFIPNTIHEFPAYALVLSDLHGHLLDTPFTLLGIALLLSLFLKLSCFKERISFKLLLPYLLIFGFLLSIMNMTNTWDGIIYLIFAGVVFGYLISQKNIFIWSSKKNKKLFKIFSWLFLMFFLVVSLTIISLPFSLNVKPFISGIGVLCAPKFLTDIGHFGPLLFEADHCQRSPLWQLYILYGAFYYFALSFIFFIYFNVIKVKKTDLFVLILVFTPIIFILIPEFVYLKDIYPAHYRANTMFKLAYQSFIFLSIASSYIIVKVFPILKHYIFNLSFKTVPAVLYIIFALMQFFLMSLYPYFAINSFYGSLKTYQGLNGISYLKNLYPTDFEAILWLNKNIKGQPVILESQGDSYSDHSRVSTNTGLPTVLGWTVHEWLWRGTYDIPAPRITDIQTLYETGDINKAKELIKKYKIELVFVGDLERQKYTKFNEDKFKNLGKIIYENGETRIYKISNF